jgi:hypothetical protein
MTLRIQLRRDTAYNWTTNNPILLSGELGIETDTARFKIGNGGRWNSITSYAFKVGEANGVASLGSTGKLLTSQLPDSFSVTADVQAAISALSTTSIREGSNKYYTDQRAIDANISAISTAISTEVSARNSQIITAKSEAVAIAAADAGTKAEAAKIEALALANSSADAKDATIKQEAINSASAYTDSKITTEVSNRNTAINTAISTEIINRNIAIAAAAPSPFTLSGHTTNELAEGITNKYFTDARAKAAVASDIATAVAGTTFSLSSKTTNDLAEGTLNKYFTNQRAVQAASPAIEASALDVITTVNGYTDEQISGLSSIYLPLSDKNANGGVAGLDSTGKISDSAIPSSIARHSDISTAVSGIVGAAPASFDTLKEIADYISSDQTAGSALTTLVGTKAPIASPTFTGTVSGITKSMVNLSNVDNTSDANKPISTATATALALKAPIASPSFTGSVSFTGATSVNFTGVSVSGLGTSASLPPQSGNQGKYLTTNGTDPSWSTITLSDYLTTLNASSTYLTKTDAASTYLTTANGIINYLSITDAENNYVKIDTLANQLNSYIMESDRNNALGFAGLTSFGYILPQIIENGSILNNKLEKPYFGLNGTTVYLGDVIQTKTYSNFNNSSAANKIGYGTSATPNVTSAVAGDIYIQY